MVKKAMLWKRSEGSGVRCGLCSHGCIVQEDEFGFCGMRENRNGELFTHAYGKVIANNVDPIEKKPLYHFMPGSTSYSVATIGCNFKCSFCQNWRISQLSAGDSDGGIEMEPSRIVAEAVSAGAKSVSYTYTEPTVFFEYAHETAVEAKSAGLANIFVTNGYMTKEAIDVIAPYLDAANIDLKFFSDATYLKMCGARLKPVLDSIVYMASLGIWIEVTTLVVPGENDDDRSLRGIAHFLAETNKEIPWHISRFHPDYKDTDKYPTMVDTLIRAKEIGLEEGLKYIYLGNVGGGNETVCPECGKVLIERGVFAGHPVDDEARAGKCSKCGTSIAGVWG